MLMAHEITINPDVQQKMINEIDEIKAKNSNAPLNYETMNSLKYMDMVINGNFLFVLYDLACMLC